MSADRLTTDAVSQRRSLNALREMHGLPPLDPPRVCPECCSAAIKDGAAARGEVCPGCRALLRMPEGKR